MNRGIPKPCTSIITQVIVDPEDPAFQHPSKPIRALHEPGRGREPSAGKGLCHDGDAGRGWRRIVASPKPRDIVEIETIRALFNAGQVVIAGGGGGIPVIREGNHLRGMGAVIDKDFCSCLMAQQVDADVLIILTAVEKCAITSARAPAVAGPHEHRGGPPLLRRGPVRPGLHAAQGGSRHKFAESAPGRRSLITLLEKAKDGIEGKTGTVIE